MWPTKGETTDESKSISVFIPAYCTLDVFTVPLSIFTQHESQGCNSSVKNRMCPLLPGTNLSSPPNPTPKVGPLLSLWQETDSTTQRMRLHFRNGYAETAVQRHLWSLCLKLNLSKAHLGALGAFAASNKVNLVLFTFPTSITHHSLHPPSSTAHSDWLAGWQPGVK